MGKTSKRLLSLAIALVMVLSMVPAGGFEAKAAETDPIAKGQQVKTDAEALENGAFLNATGTVENQTCPVCGTLQNWTALDSETLANGEALVAGGHYYVSQACTNMTSYISGPSAAGQKACLLLNQKTLRSTGLVIMGSLGTFNVMGRGIVQGGSVSDFGSTVQILSRYDTTGANPLNLYGGTYSSTDESNASPVVATHNNGGHLNIYAGATINASTGNPALYVGPGARFAQSYTSVGIYGGTIDASDSSKPAITMGGTNQNILNKLTIAGGTIKGKDTAIHVCTIAGRKSTLEITGGTIESGNIVATEAGATVAVTGGTFNFDPTTYVSAGYAATQNGTTWTVAASAQGYQAECAACGGMQTWTAIESTPTAALATGHYYIKSDLTLTASITTEAGSTVCVLNDKNLTSTTNNIFLPYGVLNIMGSGTAKVNSANTDMGVISVGAAADQIAVVNIYGGTYENLRGPDDRGVLVIGGHGGSITVHNGTFVEPIMVKGAAGKTANLTIKNGTFTGSGIIANWGAEPVANITIEGGTFNTGKMVRSPSAAFVDTNTTFSVTGGTFNFDPTDYLAAGYSAKLEGGKYVISDCSQGHNMSEATCLLPATCKACGVTEGAALGHDFQGTEEGAKCSRCDVVRDAKHPATMGNTLHCDKCDQDIAIGSWTPITASAELGNGHYYLANDIEGPITVAASANACLHLNGYGVTHATQAILVSKASSTLSIMGEGNVSATAAGNGVNNGAAVVNTTAAGAAMNIYGGTYTTSQVNRGAVVAGDYSTVKIYGGTVNGPILLKNTNKAVEIHDGEFTNSYGIFNGYGLTDKKNISILGGTFHSKLLQNPGTTETCHFNYENMPGNAIRGGIFVTNPCDYTDGYCADILENSYYQVKNQEHVNWAKVGETETWICTDCGWIDGEEIPGMTAVITPNETKYYENAADAVAAYVAGAYNGIGYIKVFSDSEIEIARDTYIDANGYKVTVTGSGKVFPMDAANDSYVSYGRFYIEGNVTIERDVTNPINGRRYITINDDSIPNPDTSLEPEIFYTTHRVEITLTNVTLRTSAAGMYYKAEYKCDDKLAGLVESYGVAVGRDKVPDKYFEDAENVGVSAIVGFTPDENHTVKGTSGALFGLMKEGYTAANNKFRAETVIYANAYFRVNVNGDSDPSTDLVVVGDEVNDGTSNGVGHSLLGLLQYIDAHWTEYADYQDTVNAFYIKWRNAGINWDDKFQNIGK